MLRGAALFGVLLVNMDLHRGPSLHQTLAGVVEPGRSAADETAAFLILWLGQGKAYTILAFLFGYGAWVMARRAQAAGIDVRPRLQRRLLGLAVLGVLHTVVLFWGDVLLLYALSGTALLVALRASDLSLLIWAAGLVAGLVVVVTSAAFTLPPLSLEDEEDLLAGASQAVDAYRGAVGDTVVQRLRDAAVGATGFVAAVPQSIAMLLFGVVAARHRLLEDRERHRPLLRRIALAGFVVGLPVNLAFALAFADGAPAGTVAFGFATLAFTAGPFVLAAGYLAGGALVAERLRILAPLGRVSLTAYLLQSVVASVIFTSYGFERYGRTGVALGLLLTVGIFAAQVALAHWWLRRHRLGPVERLLRAYTYRGEHAR